MSCSVSASPETADLMEFPFGVIDSSFIVLAGLATYFIFRRTSGIIIMHRIPLFLTSAIPLLYFRLASLPFFFERLFTKIMHLGDINRALPSSNPSRLTKVEAIRRLLKVIDVADVILNAYSG